MLCVPRIPWAGGGGREGGGERGGGGRRGARGKGHMGVRGRAGARAPFDLPPVVARSQRSLLQASGPSPCSVLVLRHHADRIPGPRDSTQLPAGPGCRLFVGLPGGALFCRLLVAGAWGCWWLVRWRGAWRMCYVLGGWMVDVGDDSRFFALLGSAPQ
jgi:hypothetical protein